MKPFGSVVFVHVPQRYRSKWDQKAEKCIFVGFSDNVKGYRVLDSRGKIVFVRDVQFVEEMPRKFKKNSKVCVSNMDDISMRNVCGRDESRLMPVVHSEGVGGGSMIVCIGVIISIWKMQLSIHKLLQAIPIILLLNQMI